MVENFENINSLIQKIKEDKKTKNVTEKRFPVRYIFCQILILSEN
jgi:hypothetical protein